MQIYRFWQKIRFFFILLCIYYLLVIINLKQQQANNIVKKKLSKELTNILFELNYLHENNTMLKQQVIFLTKRLRIFEKNNSKQKKLNGPPEDYELLRRRIYSNTKEFWRYISFELRSLAMSVRSYKFFIIHMKTIIDEHYRSLLNDIAKLTEVDGYSQWRRKEYIYLSTLVKKRLRILQTSEDCSKAKKLACNLIVDHQSCGYGCRLHHLVNCMVIAFATKRILILDNPQNWGFISGGFTKLFFPLSNTCTSLNRNETVLPWPGNESVQVVNLSLPITAPNGPNRKRRPYPTPFNSLVLPKDLSRRLNVLHGDPAVWWIGQFVNYLIRPQTSTIDIFEDYEVNFGFTKPIVGVHIRRTDKISSFHQLEEYMYYVEEYYKLQELNGEVTYKKIYLATDDPTLFKEAYDKQVKIVCRLAYEIMNGLELKDASAQFTSLDDAYYFNDQIRRLNVAVLPHKAKRPQEMDLKVGDEIEVVENQWNGYSKGIHLRTNKSLLYPTFKVTQKIEVMSFDNYSGIKISTEELEE
ncbi:hypothetical protein AGLY_012972 [Aphis glycines]|uniref:GT23 domain-containing protein n=1 Tax=Aphis glycines TaxID=307491 RepID=A0A6G0T7D5_APHGL|nr:hypothetical protein AGLY_012972 [Aphis glycines]